MVAAVAAGSYHTCAIQGNSGLLRCWGSKAHGKASVPQNLFPVYRVGGDSCQSYECNSHKLVGIVPIAQNVLCAGSPCLPEDNTFCCIPNADCSLFVSRLQFCASDELVDSANETYCHGPHVDNCNPTKMLQVCVCDASVCACLSRSRLELWQAAHLHHPGCGPTSSMLWKDWRSAKRTGPGASRWSSGWRASVCHLCLRYRALGRDDDSSNGSSSSSANGAQQKKLIKKRKKAAKNSSTSGRNGAFQ